MFKKCRRMNFVEFPLISAIGPRITPEIFMNTPNNNNVDLDEDENSSESTGGDSA